MNTINTETSYEAYVPADEWTERRKFTKEEKEQILKSTKGVCACCGKKLTLKTMTVEHIIPIYRHGTNDMKNLTALCEQCNKDKSTLLYLPRSFYMAMKDTQKINEMDEMVRVDKKPQGGHGHREIPTYCAKTQLFYQSNRQKGC